MQHTCQKNSQQLAQRSLEFLEVHKVSERLVLINLGSCVTSAKCGCSGISAKCNTESVCFVSSDHMMHSDHDSACLQCSVWCSGSM